MKYVTFTASLALLSCQQKTQTNKVSSPDTSQKTTWVKVNFTDLKRFSRYDSVQFHTEALKMGFKQHKSGFIYIPEKNTLNIDDLPFGDYAPNGVSALVNFQGDIWYTFPISDLSYYKVAILSERVVSEKQEALYNDRLDKNYVKEKYSKNAPLERSRYELEYYDNYGLIVVETKEKY